MKMNTDLFLKQNSKMYLERKKERASISVREMERWLERKRTTKREWESECQHERERRERKKREKWRTSNKNE